MLAVEVIAPQNNVCFAVMHAYLLRLSLAFLVLAVNAQLAMGSTVTVNLDPGPAGSSFVTKEFIFSDLAGTPYNGQTVSLDLLFSGQFLVAPVFDMQLFLGQPSVFLGFPTPGVSVRGHLIGEAGHEDRVFSMSPVRAESMVGWPDGYWPAYTRATQNYRGAISSPVDPRTIEPFVVSGVHFDITLPDTADILIESRLRLSSFFWSGYIARSGEDIPILVSPDTIPTYTVVPVPDAGDTGALLLCGLVALAAVRGSIRATEQSRHIGR